MENTGYIKDLDCTKDTPVIYGHEDAPDIPGRAYG